MDDHTTTNDDAQRSGASSPFPREEFLGLVRAGLWPDSALAYLGIEKVDWERARGLDPKLSADARKP